MSIIDISLPLYDGCPHWPGDEPFAARTLGALADGNVCDLSAWSGSVHLGTHADAPSHFIPDGATIDQIDLSVFAGPATVFDVGPDAPITAATLTEALSTGPHRLLIRSANSRPDGALDRHSVSTDYAGLSLDAAEAIVAAGVKLIGIDAWSIGDPAMNVDVHRTLLGAGMTILEGLDLRRVQPGRYELLAFPVKLVGVEAAPVRAILVAEADSPTVEVEDNDG